MYMCFVKSFECKQDPLACMKVNEEFWN